MIPLTKRNLMIFFRDRTGIFLSLLGVIIILVLYVLFLGDAMAEDLDYIKDAKYFLDSWLMAGLLAVIPITTTMGAFSIMVGDRTGKIIKDFLSSPLRRSSLAGAYVLSAFIIGVLVSVVALLLAEIYIAAAGGSLLTFEASTKVIGCILLSVSAGSGMVFFIVTFFQSHSAFATANTIIGTLIGFLAGIYLPMGRLPDAAQLAVKIFPVSHSGSLFRQVMTEIPLGKSLSGASAEEVQAFRENLGIDFSFHGHTVTWSESVIVLLMTTVVFYGLAVLNLSEEE